MVTVSKDVCQISMAVSECVRGVESNVDAALRRWLAGGVIRELCRGCGMSASMRGDGSSLLGQ